MDRLGVGRWAIYSLLSGGRKDLPSPRLVTQDFFHETSAGRAEKEAPAAVLAEAHPRL